MNATARHVRPLVLAEPDEAPPGPLCPIGYVERAVCERYELPPALVSASWRRTPRVVDARHMVWFLCCREGWSLSAIARYYGRHHTTILHGRDRMESLLAESPARLERVLGLLDEARRLRDAA